MPVFVQLVSSFSSSGKLRIEEDTELVNKALKKLQDNGAKVLDLKLSIGSHEHIVSLVYTVLYEAKSPVKVQIKEE